MSIKIVYLILAHKNPGQLARLVGKLSGQNVFYIHIDLKANEQEFRAALRPFQSQVCFVKERFKVNWGGFRQVKATLSLIRACLAGDYRFDRAVLLSGQDYPIKSKDFIDDFFEKAVLTEFVQYWELPTLAWQRENGGMDRIRYYWLIDLLNLRFAEKCFHLQKALQFKRPGLENIKIFGGSNWFMLTETCLQFISDFVDLNPGFARYFATTRCSDELFFNTIIMNSKFSAHVTNNIYRAQIWDKGPEYPRILRLDDFATLAASPDLFARKFDSAIASSLDLLNRIDGNLV